MAMMSTELGMTLCLPRTKDGRTGGGWMLLLGQGYYRTLLSCPYAANLIDIRYI